VHANDFVSSMFFIDVLGVSMSSRRPSLSVNRPNFWIGAEDDNLYLTGIAEQASFDDLFPSPNAFTAFSIVNVQTNHNIIRRAHSITITIIIPRSVAVLTNRIFVDFLPAYDSLIRGDTA
jgi:hypothetical protein